MQNHLWCPNDPRGEGIDGDDDGPDRDSAGVMDGCVSEEGREQEGVGARGEV